MIIAITSFIAAILNLLPMSRVEAAPNPDGWVRIAAESSQIDGRRLEPTCSQAEGTDATYAFWFRRGIEDGLVVYFDGGGACWDDATCALPRRAAGDPQRQSVYKAELMDADDPERMSGIFDLKNPRNPVRNWSMVFVPYCTGDVHSGSNTANYQDTRTGRPYVIEHRGWDNAQIIMRWMQTNVPRPARLLVTGSSAGAYGAATHYATLRQMYPLGSAVFLGDAGQGVTTPDFFSKRNTRWNYRLPESVFGRNASMSSDLDIVAQLARHFPRDRFAQYTTTYDATQRAFYRLMGAEKSCDAWTTKMVQDLDLRQNTSNFRSYLAKGETHTILRSPLFFSEESGGTFFTEWFGQLVAGSPPSNLACTDCLAPPASCTGE